MAAVKSSVGGASSPTAAQSNKIMMAITYYFKYVLLSQKLPFEHVNLLKLLIRSFIFIFLLNLQMLVCVSH